ncbi:MAG TPA: choice-of-anchor L domain-containing protein, partial [Bacteroidia bacterium]|nr:choice-of-anchor L domain-containing protein [Bacteroidia bacterium]
MKKSLFTILSLIFTKIIISQVNLTPTSNTLSLINSFFGGGANISNVVVNCPSGAIGTFTTTSSCTTLGIGSGIVLATGNISNINQPAGNFMSDNLGTTYSDPQLTSIEPSATNDVCILEFDIQPYCNQLLVKFVFGSEEYPEYVGLVNDAFGFFITGPGPACNPGGYNNTNVATLPNGTPISINNVNSGSNSAYYNSSSSCIVFDGFTTPITRTINVCPCATYHFKIAIADASDHIYDSGVFLDFIQCSMTLTATTSYTNSTGCSCTGVASATASGTSGPYTYTWMPGNIVSQTATNLCPGTYTVLINDNVSCSPTYSTTVNIGGSLSSMTLSTITNSVSCNGGTNGSATVNVTGGATPYSYTWTPFVSTTSVATGLSAGTYTVIVKDNNNCTTNTVITITQPPALSLTATQTQSVSCNGGNNGSASATASGGLGGYTYTWTPTGGNSSSATGLTAGIYTVTVKDANNCSATATIQIVQPPALSLTATQTQSVSCNGGNNGSASATATGGVVGYTYTWTPTGGNSSTTTGLTAGIYTVTVKDANNCSITATTQIVQPPALSLTATQTQSVSCNGGNNGSASSTATGGVGGYTYTWTPTGGNSSSATGLTAGVYTVTVKDANNCSATATTQIVQASAYTLATASQSASCSTPGSATVNVSGATPAYSYTWMPSGGNSNIATGLSPGTYTCTVKDANNCYTTAVVNITGAPVVNITSVNINSVSCNGGTNGSATVNVTGGATPYSYTWTPSVSTTSVATGLSAGTYSVNVMDNNFCSTNTVITITQPPALSLTATQTQSVSCNGGNNGSASATATGGVGGYTYTWTPTGGNSSSATGLTAGIYTVTVKDANNCSITATTQIVQPPALSLTATQTQSVSCNGGNNGSASATASGGVGGYTYTWSPTGGSLSSATGLTAGVYTVTIKDANNCSTTATTQIVQASAYTLATASQSASCSTPGSATVNVSGATPAYSYTWLPIGGNSNIATGLSPGTYTCTVKDANNCYTTAVVNITGAPIVNISSVNINSVSCNGGTNGSATVNVTGGA